MTLRFQIIRKQVINSKNQFGVSLVLYFIKILKKVTYSLNILIIIFLKSNILINILIIYFFYTH